MKVLVVGGGIAGLTAAYRLERLAPEADVVLLERDGRVGGKLLTERLGGYLVEAAPDSFLSRKRAALELCEELELGPELVGRRPENARSFVRRGGELHPLPEGLTGLVPTNLDALNESRLLSDVGKERFADEVDVPPAPPGDDESIASFVSRRFGREAYDALVEPLMTGIYGGDGELLSLRATFPQLRALELEHGSVLRGFDAQPRTERTRPPFLSLRAGMAELPGVLRDRLERTVVRTGSAVAAVRPSRQGYSAALETGEELEAGGLVLATPAFVTAQLLAGVDSDLAELLGEIPYASSVVVTLGYDEAVLEHPLDGYGYVVPRGEGGDVLACTWSSSKWEGRAPEGKVLVRVYAGRYGGRDLGAGSDEDLVALARDELRVLGLGAEPDLVRVHRWPGGMPQYVLGHPERLERIARVLQEHPGLELAGAAYDGVGIPDCIASGERAAASVVESLSGVRA
jgi:protoporphyrinogen/coproporphyrinogen III oxidase